MEKKRTAAELRYAARLAYLDGRTARAKTLNKLADQIDRAAIAKAEGR